MSDDPELLSESHAGGTLNTYSVTITPDSLQRKYQMTPRRGTTVLGGTITYGYGNASRLSSVSDGTSAAVYGYLANSPLVEQTTFWDGPALRMTTTKAYDNLNRLSSIANVAHPAAGTYVASSHAYLYNNANQRTETTLRDGSYWTYGYDALGQVNSGKKRFNDGTWVPGEQFEYTFDELASQSPPRVSFPGRDVRVANCGGNRTATKAGRRQCRSELAIGQLHANFAQSIYEPHRSECGEYVPQINRLSCWHPSCFRLWKQTVHLRHRPERCRRHAFEYPKLCPNSGPIGNL